MGEKKVDLNEFHLVPNSVEKTDSFSFNVMADGRIRLNGKMIARVKEVEKAEYARIYLSGDGKRILLETYSEKKGNDSKVLARGVITNQNLKDELEKLKIKLPAHFRAKFVEELKMWLGVYDLNYRFSLPKVTSAKLCRPKKKGLAELLPGGDLD